MNFRIFIIEYLLSLIFLYYVLTFNVCIKIAFFQHQQCNWADSCTQYSGQLVILRPAGLQIFPRRDALGLIGKWTLKNNKWDVIIKTGQ